MHGALRKEGRARLRVGEVGRFQVCDRVVVGRAGEEESEGVDELLARPVRAADVKDLLQYFRAFGRVAAGVLSACMISRGKERVRLGV